MQSDISPRLAFLAVMAALLALLGGCSDPGTAPAPGPDAPLHGTWRALELDGQALPARMYHFDPELLHGVPVSVHLMLDSARLQLLPGGGYVHRVWMSEWHGEPDGPPKVRLLRHHHYDHGLWDVTGAAIHLESGWLQNHRIDGTAGAAALHLKHGFSHGDEELPITYRR
jgi:hypothetical protein